ncbi:H-NS histone family protein [Burkholderia sp. Ac-20345]|uniref:H-NS histone family protein n=1 Tax=Burkholderia sp. Ac-20345 TaxID=2703891 RepID=UPI00197C9509|nr:H-NS histone family protein [Burkholderia sp. Ac-20345]MBN3779025.1 H-NS histone family protein [Burkholderia sp. Ac-20345]
MSKYKEILTRIDMLHSELEMARSQEAALLAEKIREVLRESGVDLNLILAGHENGSSKRAKIKPKYWNPETGTTWSGRGRTPLWLQGKNPSDYLIEPEQPIDTSSGDSA